MAVIFRGDYFMKKLLLIFIILFCSNVSSGEVCNSSEVKNARQLEKAQDCLIVQLENINTSLKDIDEYVEYTTILTEEMIEEKVLCEEFELLYSGSPESINTGILEMCKQARLIRLRENAKVLKEMNKMKPKVKELEKLKKGLELELKILIKLAPVFGIKLNENKD